MEDFTSEEAVAVKMQGYATSVDPQREICLVPLPPEAKKSGGASVSVDIENLDETWVDSIKKKVGDQPKKFKTSSASESCSIHRVPHLFRHHDEKVRVPQIISIGPFHFDKRKDQLGAMEEHKWRFLHDILTRNGDDCCLEQYLRAIKKLENEARECYSEEFDKLDSNSFVEMLVLDGCFIIELFRREWFEQYEDDPIFRLRWLKRSLVIDLIMQENQIPFLILEHLSNLMNVSEPSPAEGALCFFKDWVFLKKLLLDTRISHPEPKIHHLLHLLHTNLVFIERIYPQWNGESINLVESASKLTEAGLRFKKTNDAHKLLDVKFDNGVIEIPPLIVEDMTYPIFFNLVAFEHSYRHCKKDFSAYIAFMDGLFNTARDVEILCPIIIDNWLGSDEEVAALFNNMGREELVQPNNFYLVNVVQEINQYYGKFCPRMRVTLKHDYCKTPFAIISIFAAIFLLLLSLAQAFFSAFPKFALQKKGN